jgi:hypothetical protein
MILFILSGDPGDDCDYMLPVASEIAQYADAILLEQRGTGRANDSPLVLPDRSSSNCLAGEKR